MTSQALVQESPQKLKTLHPWPIRVMHWLNALVMIIMITSGWGIYNDNVIFSWLVFPEGLKLGHWAQDSLLWHFGAMWFLGVNGLFYLTFGIVTGRFRRKLFPIEIADFVETLRETLRLHLAHDDITHYNAVQKLMYIVVIIAGVMQVISGVAIWKPVQFSWLTALMGGFQTARLIHFLGMAVIVGFFVVHVALALLVPKTLLAMLTGGPKVTIAPETPTLESLKLETPKPETPKPETPSPAAATSEAPA